MIINADDFGRTQSINSAIEQSIACGFINQTTIMVNMPAFDEGVELSKERGFYDKVGLHLTLDEGVPLTESIKHNTHFCKDGQFIKGCFKGILKITLSKYDKCCLENEIDAQMKRYVAAGFPLMHIDSHHHVHTNISVLRIVAKLSKKFGFKSARIAAFHESDSTGKRLYKKVLNWYIRRNFKTTDIFIPYTTETKQFEGNNNVEMMTHPDIIDGRLVDVLRRNPLTVRNIEM